MGEVTCGGSPHLSCKRDQIEMSDYMDRRVTPPTWGPHPALSGAFDCRARCCGIDFRGCTNTQDGLKVSEK